MATAESKDSSMLIRIPEQLKAELHREAAIHGRSLTSEVNIRLKASLQQGATDISEQHMVRERAASWPAQGALTDAERVLVSQYKRLSPEKQLALLSLLK
jgi:plasmid stability protein